MKNYELVKMSNWITNSNGEAVNIEQMATLEYDGNNSDEYFVYARSASGYVVIIADNLTEEEAKAFIQKLTNN